MLQHFVNSISITLPQANIIIGGIVILIVGMGFREVWNILCGKDY
jgi:hypothetical protein